MTTITLGAGTAVSPAGGPAGSSFSSGTARECTRGPAPQPGRATALEAAPPPVHCCLGMSVFTKILRAGEGKKVRALQALVPDIDAFEPEMEALSDEGLRHKTVEFRERLDNGEDVHDLLIESFAVVREGAKRVIGQRHFPVQLMGGAALHFGWIAEMKTGEGKTLVSTLPVYLNGLTGKGVHVVTVNDYLARRDAEWMGRIHRFLGLSIGLVVPEIDDWDMKKAAYNSDITYGTNT